MPEPRVTIRPTMPDGSNAPSIMDGDDLLAYLRHPAKSDDAKQKALQRLMNKGLVPIRPGQQNLYRLEDVCRWVDKQK